MASDAAQTTISAISANPTWTWAIPLIVGVLTFSGVATAALITIYNIKRQIQSAHALKLAEMRQTWINNLRDAMATFQSYAVAPGISQLSEREFFEKGTKIELMMNSNDPDYSDLHKAMYTFFRAESKNEKYAANAKYISVCQKVLKREWNVLKAEIAKAGGKRG